MLNSHLREASVSEVSVVGLDIAKHVFQAHGADASGSVVFRKEIARARLLAFFASQPRCHVVLEACGSAHRWARELMKLGHGSTRRSGADRARMRSHGG